MTTTQKKKLTHTLCALALLTAMMVLLTMTISIQTPFFKLSFGSLPVVLAAMLFGPLEGVLVAVLGEFIIQVIGPYGLMPTTFIWIWPPAIRALVVGSAAVWLRRSGTRLESRPVVCYVVCVIGAILTTIGNTAGMWLDSLFNRTSFAAAALWVPARFVSGTCTAVIIATICMPLVHSLRRSGVLRYTE
ncbi:folate family ECF transporter S component [Colidextribacter sp. OB.20]|uniref:folate family ECF transporter S component n=1 Tax=Colidextribacter sp. OB.20 TaxID=2304568 RepID=UPI00136E5D21|nr:folate family ECF transporter S component [Colidextribacter sp. OB.20]NBI11533.1 folate family ECF transporter S component [Colidextribacter sp. OB.20]